MFPYQLSTFRPKHKKEKDALKATAPQSKCYKQKAKRTVSLSPPHPTPPPKKKKKKKKNNGQTAIQNIFFHQGLHAIT